MCMVNHTNCFYMTRHIRIKENWFDFKFILLIFFTYIFSFNCYEYFRCKWCFRFLFLFQSTLSIDFQGILSQLGYNICHYYLKNWQYYCSICMCLKIETVFSDSKPFGSLSTFDDNIWKLLPGNLSHR